MQHTQPPMQVPLSGTPAVDAGEREQRGAVGYQMMVLRDVGRFQMMILRDVGRFIFGR